MSTIYAVAAPMETRGFLAKAGTLAAGTALAGAVLFGGTVVAPTITEGLTASVQHDIMLTATPFPTFTESLQNLLDTLKFGNIGEVLGAFGTAANPINSASELSALLSLLNPGPNPLSLDDATGHLLSTDISGLLATVMIAGPNNTAIPLGTVPIDSLIGGFIGGTGANESIGDVLGALGFGPYVGLLDLPFLNLSPVDTVGSLLTEFLGIKPTDTLNDLVIGSGQTLGNATIGGLLGISSTELAAGWDTFVDNIKLGGTIMNPDGTGVLGDETLGALLTALLGPGATAVTDDTTVTDFLAGLDIFHMLGLT
ncbi:hypothetical protein [[Mycobacterium] crassicus]|uniref:PE-PGRS family protein n=1 Tax=[Mycobacterium] crassicus TaxID=2872309 RepID=A0ABU5XC80_9MYCO|nr:hypothetical protein [Mycolicibacter sp. MYC098]MEB3019900.1 hypothetical protein [Mycolicibacter sp. MYC098]